MLGHSGQFYHEKVYIVIFVYRGYKMETLYILYIVIFFYHRELISNISYEATTPMNKNKLSIIIYFIPLDTTG